jgi:hypothetical protein
VALSPQNNDAFMREVDDAVREDALRDFFNRYGKAMLAATTAALVALAGWLWWQSDRSTDTATRGGQFSAVLDQMSGTQPASAAAAAEPLAKGSDPGYRAAALMLQATAAAAQNNAELAATRFASVANDQAVPRELRDVALIRQTLVQFDRLEPSAIIARLRSIVANPENGSFSSAAELTALAELRRNNTRRAGVLFQQIARNDNTPPTLQARAVQMAAMLGVDAPAGTDNDAAPRPATATQTPQPATKE